MKIESNRDEIESSRDVYLFAKLITQKVSKANGKIDHLRPMKR